eukprot:scaffold1554_cov401-Prasinococcus_capsulatus_cf.AAC.35
MQERFSVAPCFVVEVWHQGLQAVGDGGRIKELLQLLIEYLELVNKLLWVVCTGCSQLGQHFLRRDQVLRASTAM